MKQNHRPCKGTPCPPESFRERHRSHRTPDYIMITIVVLYFIGYPLQSYLREEPATKPKTEERHTRRVPETEGATTDNKSPLPQGHKGQ